MFGTKEVYKTKSVHLYWPRGSSLKNPSTLVLLTLRENENKMDIKSRITARFKLFF